MKITEAPKTDKHLHKAHKKKMIKRNRLLKEIEEAPEYH